ncbi:hypothetical protein GCM10022222_10170 [Amycolatopsis ultiminotia]|uniref:Periplasmic binding protein domain-containing protein n=1 Tax=Amycolatopsis ultiminotia TaxID=543629 RepID=A0ABP6V913_9PSEU
MSPRTGKIRRFGALLLVLPILTSACSGSGGSPANASGPKALTHAEPYTGPEAGLPTRYPEPTKTNAGINVGIACAACQIPGVALGASAARKTIEGLGGRVTLLDAGGDPQKQLSQFRQFVAQRVQAIIVQPLVETAMAPAFVDARVAGIPVITIGSPGDTTKPLLPGVTSNVTFGLDQAAFTKARYLAMSLPKDAEIGVLGYGVPSDSVKYGVDRTEYWAQQFGLKIAQRSDVPDLTINAGQVAGTAMLERNPGIKAVVSFTDAITAGVLVSARQLNKRDVIVCGTDYDKNGYQAVSTKNGSCSVRWNWEGLGKSVAQAAYLAATKQTTPPVVSAGGGTLVTKDNYEQVPVVG